MAKTWERAIVVGASSGIGEAMARQLAAAGTAVALVARRQAELERIREDINRAAGGARSRAFAHDVRKTDEVSPLFQEITTTLGGLNLLVYASGVMPARGLEEYPTDRDLEMIEVNFTGAVAWLNEAARRFGRARSGTIVGISSVAGDRGRAKNPVYNATKAAMDTYLEALRARLAQKGVDIVTVKPGFVRTPLLENEGLSGLVPVLPADEAARKILQAAAAGKRVVYVPQWWRPIMLVVRAIPAPIFERIKL
jgi:short-subunit dehydrogenase